MTTEQGPPAATHRALACRTTSRRPRRPRHRGGRFVGALKDTAARPGRLHPTRTSDFSSTASRTPRWSSGRRHHHRAERRDRGDEQAPRQELTTPASGARACVRAARPLCGHVLRRSLSPARRSSSRLTEKAPRDPQHECAGSGQILAFLSWLATDALYGVDLAGGLHRSTDNGATWQKTGTVPGGRPQALTAVGAKRVLAATQDGVYESRDGGKTFSERLPVSTRVGH